MANRLDDRFNRLADDFELELRDQLRARSAPAGFADRVMARVAERGPAARKPRPSWLLWRWTAVAAVLVLTVLGGLEHDRQQRIAGERARQQVLLALHITGSTLNQVQRKVNDSSAQPTGRQPNP
ncbi:MAG TPA: hypothetical protein VHX60_09125 [Acidobacteriaceae bacterium]|nr:hypothetical protein [Acidobacteriaceae bacterium]